MPIVFIVFGSQDSFNVEAITSGVLASFSWNYLCMCAPQQKLNSGRGSTEQEVSKGLLTKLNCGEKHFQSNSQDIWAPAPFSPAWWPTHHRSVKKYLAIVSKKFRPVSGAFISEILKRAGGQAAFGGVGEGVDPVGWVPVSFLLSGRAWVPCRYSLEMLYSFPASETVAPDLFTALGFFHSSSQFLFS